MAFVKTTDKWLAIHAFINTWLKDPTWYCNNCGVNYFPCCDKPRLVDVLIQDTIHTKCSSCDTFVIGCCENPQIGNNKDHTYALIRQNKEQKELSLNQFASTKDKTLRWGISLPPKLYHDMDNYWKKTTGEKLFENKKDLRKFMKKFPQFKIPKEI